MVSLKLLVSEIKNALRMLENDECGMNDEQRESALRMIEYYKKGVNHYDERTARGCIAQMYYYENETNKRYAPYFTYNQIEMEYKKLSHLIPEYNLWDFAVAMNLIYSNHREVIKKWTKGEDKLTNRVAELAISFLTDEDTLHPEDKIYWYMQG